MEARTGVVAGALQAQSVTPLHTHGHYCEDQETRRFRYRLYLKHVHGKVSAHILFEPSLGHRLTGATSGGELDEEGYDGL